MPIHFTEEKEREGWDEFILAHNGDFLQSWAWGELQKSEGSPAGRFSIRRNGELIGRFQAYAQKTRLGPYLYIPRGPVFAAGATLAADEQKEFASFTKTIAPECIFILCEPLRDTDLPHLPNFNNLQPQKTVLIDLTRPTEELRKEVAYSRRQGMHFATKKGVRISHADSKDYFEIFNSLIQKTGTRQGFGTFDAGHYRSILAALPAEIFIATHDGNPQTQRAEQSSHDENALAAAEVIFWGNTATYLHAGSDDANKKMRGPDLLIWSIIEESKNRGFKKFDFWGIDENRWPGVTTFKKSFGGSEQRYPKARIIVNKQLPFLIYKALKALKGLIKMVY